MLRLTLAVAAALLMSACATQSTQKLYEGSDQTAGVIQSASIVQILYIDDEEVKAGFIGQTPKYRVEAGERVVMVEYADLFNIDNDEHEKVVSRPAKVTFTVEGGSLYEIQSLAPTELEAAKAFAEQPTVQVVNVKTGAVIASNVELSRPRTVLTQLKSAVTPTYEFGSDQVAPGAALEELKAVWQHL